MCSVISEVCVSEAYKVMCVNVLYVQAVGYCVERVQGAVC